MARAVDIASNHVSSFEPMLRTARPRSYKLCCDIVRMHDECMSSIWMLQIAGPAERRLEKSRAP